MLNYFITSPVVEVIEGAEKPSLFHVHDMKGEMFYAAYNNITPIIKELLHVP